MLNYKQIDCVRHPQGLCHSVASGMKFLKETQWSIKTAGSGSTPKTPYTPLVLFSFFLDMGFQSISGMFYVFSFIHLEILSFHQKIKIKKLLDVEMWILRLFNRRYQTLSANILKSETSMAKNVLLPPRLSV